MAMQNALRRRPRILYITADYPPRLGGQSRLSQYLVESLRTAYDVTVYVQQVFLVNEGGVHTLIEPTGETFLGRCARKSESALHVSRALSIAWRLGRDFDLIIAGDSARSSFVASYYAWLFRKKNLINLAHGRDFCWRNFRGIKGRLHRFLLRSNILTIANSNKTKQYLLEKKLAKKTVVIHPAVALERYYPLPDADNPAVQVLQSGSLGKKRPIILTVARLVPRKGIEIVIEALSQIKEDFLYVVAGTGPLQSTFEAKASLVGLGNKILFLGNIDDESLIHYYNACDFFILTPYDILEGDRLDYEGFGMVYLEANACGKPVIGSRTGGIPEAILEGMSGMIVDPKDVKQTAAAIRKLMNDHAFRLHLSAGAREWSKNFGTAVTEKSYLKAIDQVLAGGRQ